MKTTVPQREEFKILNHTRILPTSQTSKIYTQTLRAPTRIDFSGGWSDIPFLIKDIKKPGFVSNCAIKPHITLTGSDLHFASYTRGVGLSTSTAAKALELIQFSGGESYLASRNLTDITEDLFRYENKNLSWAIGRQDMHTIIHGGINLIEFGKTYSKTINSLTSIRITKNLRQHLLLIYSGQSRNAQVVVEEVYFNFNTGNYKYLQALNTISSCGQNFWLHLKKNDIPSCASIMNINWTAQKILASSTSNSYLDNIYQFALCQGALGGKLCGAGGGGCFIFITPHPENLSTKLTANIPNCFPINFEIELKNIKEINVHSKT